MTTALAATLTTHKASTYFGGGRIKALGSGKVGGYLVVFGGEKDSQGEYFMRSCNFHLDWYQGAMRPVLYHHGLTEEDVIESIGYITSLTVDNKGLYAEAQLDMTNPIAQKVYADITAGKIGWSSGSAPHLSKVDDNGGIWEWTVIEASLTPTPAAGKRTTVQALKFNYSSTFTEPSKVTTPTAKEHLAKEPTAVKESNSMVSRKGGNLTLAKPRAIMAMKYDAAMIAALRDEGIEADKILNILEKMAGGGEAEMMTDDVGDSEVVDPAIMSDTEDDVEAKDAGPVVEGDGGAEIEDTGATPAMTPPRQTPPPVGEEVKRKKSAGIQAAPDARTFAQQVRRELERTAPAKSKANGFTGRNPARFGDKVADIKAQYGDLDAADMAFGSLVIKRLNRLNPDKQLPIAPEFYHVMATKAMEDVEDKKLRFNVKDKELSRTIRAMAIKDSWNNTLVAGEGANWVPDLWSSQLWMRVRIDNNVAKNIEVFQMPSPTFEYPVESTDPTVYSVGQADTDIEMTFATNAFTKSRTTVDKFQFVAKKTGLQVPFSTEMEEDSIIPFIPQLRAQAVRAFANSIDFNLLNSDDTTGTGNINYKGGNTSSVPAANFLFGGGDGMRHNPLVNNTAVQFSFAGGAPTLAGIRTARFKLMSSLNTYGINPEDLMIIADPFTYGKFLSIDEINVFMNNGRGATVNTGLVPNIDGTPVYPSWELKLTDSTGFVTNTNDNVPSATNYGNFLVVAKPAWKVGYVRQVMTDVSFVPWSDAYVLTMTCRYAIGKKDTVASALGYYLQVS